MSAQWTLFWLIANTLCAAWFAHELREDNSKDRGWNGFWLAANIYCIVTGVQKLLTLLA